MTEDEKKTLDTYDNIPKSVDDMMGLLAGIYDYMWKGYEKELATILLEYERDGRSDEINAQELRELLQSCKRERKDAKQGYLHTLKIKAFRKKERLKELSSRAANSEVV